MRPVCGSTDVSLDDQKKLRVATFGVGVSLLAMTGIALTMHGFATA
jgi:hypothetical protein